MTYSIVMYKNGTAHVFKKIPATDLYKHIPEAAYTKVAHVYENSVEVCTPEQFDNAIKRYYRDVSEAAERFISSFGRSEVTQQTSPFEDIHTGATLGL